MKNLITAIALEAHFSTYATRIIFGCDRTREEWFYHAASPARLIVSAIREGR